MYSMRGAFPASFHNFYNANDSIFWVSTITSKWSFMQAQVYYTGSRETNYQLHARYSGRHNLVVKRFCRIFSPWLSLHCCQHQYGTCHLYGFHLHSVLVLQSWFFHRTQRLRQTIHQISLKYRFSSYALQKNAICETCHCDILRLTQPSVFVKS